MTITKIPSYELPTLDSFPQSKVSWPFDASRAVLLIHDMQQYFLDFYGEKSPLIAQVTANIKHLKAWCKIRAIPVIYTAQPSEQKPQDRALLNDMWGPGLTTVDARLQHIVPDLSPDNDDTVLTKWRYSAFHRSDLAEIMKNGQRDQIIICGVYAHIGCMTTALDAFMRDIKPFLVGDALADFSEEEHRWAMRYVATRCGRVVGTTQIAPLDSSASLLTKDGLHARLLTLIDAADRAHFDANENLVDYGLDSVRMMNLVAEWRKLGIALDFEDLARAPSLNGWWSTIEEKLKVI